jgi:hypothetical protein
MAALEIGTSSVTKVYFLNSAIFLFGSFFLPLIQCFLFHRGLTTAHTWLQS